MKKYTVLKAMINDNDESPGTISFLNAEGMCVVNILDQSDVDKEYLKASVVIFTNVDKAKEFKAKLEENPGKFKFHIFEVETVYSSLWKNSSGETQGNFHGYRILGEIE